MSPSLRSLFVVCVVAVSTPACAGSGCPKPGSTPKQHSAWEAALDAKAVLSLDPAASIAIKRDVHNQIVSIDAKPLADALNAVLMDPKRRFGLIQIDRKQATVGKPFSVGERFQGRYSLEGAIVGALGDDVKRLFDTLKKEPAFADAICEIENNHLSDYGVVSEIVLSPPDAREFRFSYRYLAGSPIAGSSTFVITQLEPGKSRVTQIFVYQEQSRAFADFFSTSGLKLHNQVVKSEISQAAALGGGEVLESDVPAVPAKQGAT